MNLLAVGSIAFDSIKTPFGKADKTLGGSLSYFALAASNFVKPSVVGVVGEDFTDKYLTVFKNKNIDISGLERKSGKTFFWSGEYDFDLGHRTTLELKLNVFKNFKPKLSPSQASANYIFLANIHPKLQLDVLKQIKKPKIVGLDTAPDWIANAKTDLLKILKLTDIFVINDAEARQLSGERNLLKTAKKILKMMSRRPYEVGIPTDLSSEALAKGGASGGKPKNPILIIKQGEHGLLMFHQNEIFNLPGYPLENVIDPTGAGDSFAGGFMGYLAKTDDLSYYNLKKACAFGSTIASFCVEKMGTKRLQNLTLKKIKTRFGEFGKIIHFKF